MNRIQINKFSELHDGKNIIFCKTDYILNEFDYINKLDNEVILITGNSDYSIDDKIVSNLPKNVKRWFAQNVISNHEKLEPIPIGLENYKPSIREGHGIGYDRVLEKENILNSIPNNIIPNKFIYSNFQIMTNLEHRGYTRKIISDLPYIEWGEPNLSISDFFNKILEYEAVLCPIGNGIDTHRLWEVLYSNRIPITIKVGNFKIYELYEKLPIVILDNYNELKNFDLLRNKINEIKNKKYNMSLLDITYWINKITEI